MSVSLTKNPVTTMSPELAAELAAMGISTDTIREMVAKGARESLVTRLSSGLTEAVGDIVTTVPPAASGKEGSTWVGTLIGGIKVAAGGKVYTVQVSVKDETASSARKAAAQG